MTDQRPDPDALLAQVEAEEKSTKRGRLKIFFGAAPGVGKTYAMLEAARREAREGVDVVVGYIEPHVRPETQALVLGLDILARKSIEYRGATLQEFDLDAALARHPAILLVDELAHTNAEGSLHAKRWQDVDQLLGAGIDVYTTLNVQHLESLNDVVARITGIQVRETVPDSVFDEAHEVELVDLPPEDLVERLREGKVYVPGQALRALEHFFRRGNLIALRELALRRTAERVGAEVRDYRRAMAIPGTWPTGDRLLVCVGPSPLSARLVRATRRMAAIMQSPWVALHVEEPGGDRFSDGDRERLNQNLQLAEQLGAQVESRSGASIVDEVLHFARDNNVTKIIVGKPRQPLWQELLRGSFVYSLTRKCGDIDVYVISGDAEDAPESPRRLPTDARSSWRPYLKALAVVGICTGLNWLLSPRLALVNLVMVYLIGVVFVSLRFGQGPSILASLLGVAVFDFVFVPPRGTFAVADTEYLFTFGAMLVTGLTISTLTARLRNQVESARARERRIAALHSLSRDLAALTSQTEIVESVVRTIGLAANSHVAVLLPVQGSLQAAFGSTEAFVPDERDRAVAQWAYDNGRMAGMTTGTLPGASALYLPLSVAGAKVGVIGVRPRDPIGFRSPEVVRLLEAFASQAAAAFRREELARETEEARVEIETERLRNSLLSSVSHDLRTPLAAIAGAASTLLADQALLDQQTRLELLQTIVDEADDLNRLVGNLLDATRLDSGMLRIRREWQSLEELVGVVLKRLGRQLRQHPVSVHLTPDLPLVEADGVLLQQVLVNLLENAAKYSHVGSPIEVSAYEKDKRLFVEIADRGRGIAPGDEQRIFEKFFRGGDRASRGGAGLGLTICRAIVALHGGDVMAENREGGGALFRFWLPVSVPPLRKPLEADQSV